MWGPASASPEPAEAVSTSATVHERHTASENHEGTMASDKVKTLTDGTFDDEIKQVGIGVQDPAVVSP